jgi:hypothetical protein
MDTTDGHQLADVVRVAAERNEQARSAYKPDQRNDGLVREGVGLTQHCEPLPPKASGQPVTRSDLHDLARSGRLERPTF